MTERKLEFERDVSRLRKLAKSDSELTRKFALLALKRMGVSAELPKPPKPPHDPNKRFRGTNDKIPF